MLIKKVIREYFSYTTSEKRGLLVLIVILVTIFVFPLIFSTKEEYIEISDNQETIDSLLSLLREREDKKYHLFPFDPNKVSNEELKKLGFTQIQISNLLKYRESGGVFKNRLDLKKIYGITEEDFNRFEDYILLSNKEDETNSKVYLKPAQIEMFIFDPNTIAIKDWLNLGVDKRIANRIKKYLSTGARFNSAEDLTKIYGMDSMLLEKLKPFVKIVPIKKITKQFRQIELNMADTTALKLLPGIGSVLSRRIVKYRNLLGGFSNIEQLSEVYGISESTFTKFKDRIRVESKTLKQLSINKCDANTLGRHPYINKRIASDIIKYRDRTGKYQAVEDLRLKHLVNDSIYQKLIPYLCLD